MAQMQEQLDKLEKQNAEQAALLAEKEEEVKNLKAEGAGWLVITPMPDFDGTTAGIKFLNGMAFVAANRKIPRFEVQPIKESTMQKAGYTPKEQEAIREREKMTSAQRAVLTLENDYGYQVEYYDGQNDKALAEKLDARARERSALEALQERLAEQMSVTTRPHFMGG